MMERALPFVSVGKAVAGTVIIAVLSLFLLPLYPLLLLLLPLPAAYVTAREGWIAGVVVAVVAGALLYLAPGPGTALMTFLLLTSAGVTLGMALRRGWRFSRTLAVMAVSLLVALVVYGIVAWLAFGVRYADLEQELQAVIKDTTALYLQAGMSSATADAFAGYVERLAEVLPYLAPGLLGMTAVLGAATMTALAYLIFPRLRKPQAVKVSLSGFRMHWGFAYVSIIGLALVLFSRSGEGWRAVPLYAGIDLLMVSQTLFFLQALGVLRWLGHARQWPTGPRVLAFISAVLAQSFQFTGLMGLLDTWIDYRKRLALRSSGPGSLS